LFQLYRLYNNKELQALAIWYESNTIKLTTLVNENDQFKDINDYMQEEETSSWEEISQETFNEIQLKYDQITKHKPIQIGTMSLDDLEYFFDEIEKNIKKNQK
jgi:hypothetical protein